jgi:hypothetical protein
VLEDLNRIDPKTLSDRVEDLRKVPTDDSDVDTLHLSDTAEDATIKVDPIDSDEYGNRQDGEDEEDEEDGQLTPDQAQ